MSRQTSMAKPGGGDEEKLEAVAEEPAEADQALPSQPDLTATAPVTGSTDPSSSPPDPFGGPPVDGLASG